MDEYGRLSPAVRAKIEERVGSPPAGFLLHITPFLARVALALSQISEPVAVGPEAAGMEETNVKAKKPKKKRRASKKAY